MKKLSALFLSIAILTLCSACENQTIDNSSNTDNTSSTDDSSKPDLNFGDPIDKHENPITYYTKEEVKEMIEKNGNLKVNDGFFYALVPKTVDHVSEFVTGLACQLQPKEELEEFKTVFKYLFPNHELDENCLYYYNGYDDVDNTLAVNEAFFPLSNKEVYDTYMAGGYVHGGLTFMAYTEAWSKREESVCLFYRSPFGNDYCVFNKGVLQKYDAELNGKTTYSASDIVSVRDYEGVKRLPPDSEEKFKLLDDKEISVKDAVKFFEDYIVSIPVASKHSGYNIHVDEVNVYRLPDNEHYIYFFRNSREFDNIPFTFWDGTGTGNDEPDLSEGLMAVTDDVDWVYAPYNANEAFDEKRYTEFIPFEEAVKTISEKLTDYVDFKVTRAELMYKVSERIYWGSIIGENFERARPVWKLTLENPNDDVTYVAYLDALTGDFSGGR